MLTTNADKVSSDALCWSMNHILYKMQNNISEAVLTNSLQEDKSHAILLVHARALIHPTCNGVALCCTGSFEQVLDLFHHLPSASSAQVT